MTEIAVIASMLNSALAHIGKSVAQHPKLPVLGCVRLSAADSTKRMSIEATDLITAQRVTIPCALTMKAFDVVVPYKVLKEYVALGEQDLRLDLWATPQGLYLRDGRNSANFKGYDPAEFPKVPTLDDTWERVATWQATRAWRGRPSTGDVKTLKAEVEVLERYAIADSDKHFTEDNFGRYLRLTFTPSALYLRTARPTALAERVLTEYRAELTLTVDVPRASFSAALAAHNGESDCVEVLVKRHADGEVDLCLKSDVREVYMRGREPKGGELETPELLWRGEVETRSLLSIVSKAFKKDVVRWVFAAKDITLERGDQSASVAVSWSKTADVEFVGRAEYTLTEDDLMLAVHAVRTQKKAATIHIGLAVYKGFLPMLVIYSPHGAEYIRLTAVRQ